jgi:N-acetylmuramoyl-L-alanine amidase
LSVGSLLLLALTALQPQIDVVYPRIAPGDTIPRIDHVDSNFVFGSVQPPDAKLWINDTPVQVRKNGAFLAFLPVDWEKKHYVVTASTPDDSAKSIIPFTTKPVYTPPPPSAAPELPRLIELSSAPIRTDPKGTYFIFPSAGTRVLATGWSTGYYKVPIAPGRSAWVEAKSIRDLSSGAAPSVSVITKVTVDTLGGNPIVRIPLDRKILVAIRDETEPNRLIVELFGAVSHIDRINYPHTVSLVREIYWEQPSESVVRLDMRLAGPLWGYYGVWEDKSYILHLRSAPELGRGINGLSVAIDAGHGGDLDGAIGPMRVKEKDVNLVCAITLARQLEEAGAKVILTRTTDTALGLSERVSIVEASGADILISLHHNALPDGVDPFGPGPFGTSTHYYRPQSRDLALAVQNSVVAELKLPDEGLYYDDLALARPSFMPAILLEAAYVMMPEQEAIISDPDYADRLAEAVLKGINKFIDGRR